MIDTDMPKDVRLDLRISEDEHAAWKMAADEAGLKLSEWIRRRCNGIQMVAAPPPRGPIPFEQFPPELQHKILKGGYPTDEEVAAAMRKFHEEKRARTSKKRRP